MVGSAATVTRSDAHYQACERDSTLLRWCGREDTLIDRHDARALLDSIHEGPPRRPLPRPSDEAVREEHLATFERYRDLVRLLRRGYGGAEQQRGLALVVHEGMQRRVEAVGHTAPTARGLKSGEPGQAAQQASHAAVPFSYGGTTVAGEDEEDEGGDSDDSCDTDDSQDAQAAALAAACGIRDLGWHVRADKRRRTEEAGRDTQWRRTTVKEVRLLRRPQPCRSTRTADTRSAAARAEKARAAAHRRGEAQRAAAARRRAGGARGD